MPPPSWPGAPPTSGPPVSPYPPYMPESMQRIIMDPARAGAKMGSNLLIGGAVFHALAIPIGLLVVKFVAENAARRTISWGELFGALQQMGLLGAIVIAGIFAQAIFATVSGIGAFLLRAGRHEVAIPMIVVGVVAVVCSFAIFGGFVGAIGGFLTIAGGAKGREKPPSPWPTVPPPYYGPPPYRP